MPGKIHKIQIIILVGVFFILLSYSFDKWVFSGKSTSIAPDEFKETLVQKEKHLNAILQKTKNYINDKDLANIPSIKKLPFSKASLKENGFEIFIYHNDSLKFWSNNIINVNNRFSDSKLRQRVIKQNNGWYLAHYKKTKDVRIAGLILIKKRFPINNRYLNRRFQKDFNLPSAVHISHVKLSYSTEITDKNGNYLLSLVPEDPEDKEHAYTPAILASFFLGILIFFIGLVIYLRDKSIYNTIISFILITGVRYLMIQFNFPHFLYSTSLFNPDIFADSFWFASPGDLFIDSLIIFFLAIILFTNNNFFKLLYTIPQWLRILYTVIILGTITGIISGITYLIGSLLYNSTISFEIYNVLQIDGYTLIAITVIGLLFASFVLLTLSLLDYVKRLIRFPLFFIIGILIIGIFTFIISYADYQPDLLSLIFFTAFIILISYLIFFEKKINYNIIILIIFLLSGYFTAYIVKTLQEKRTDEQKLLVSNLTDQRDIIAEELLNKRAIKINKDDILKNNITQGNIGSQKQADKILRYLKNNYFNGYFEKYALEVFICGEGEHFEPLNIINNCAGYFQGKIEKYGTPIEANNYYFLENKEGNISYLGEHKFNSNDSNAIVLYTQLNSRLSRVGTGYPSLLLSSKAKKHQLNPKFSYAKYKNNQLTKKSGDFSYDLTDHTFNKSDKIYEFIKKDGFIHLVYRYTPNQKIILTQPSLKPIDVLITFSYIFVFFIILFFIIYYFSMFQVLSKQIHSHFKNRLKLAMFTLLFLSFILIGAGTIYFNKQQFEKKHRNTIREKIESVSSELEHKFYNTTTLNPNWSSERFYGLDELLAEYREVFNIEINLFNKNGNLIASSRPEIFHRKIISNKMNYEAYQALLNDKPKYIHSENIGDLKYASAYIPFYNKDEELLAYVNLPYFTKPKILHKEITNLIIAVINLYVLFLLITGAIAVLIANRVTYPLVLLERKFHQAELGKKNEPIDYHTNDEIGRLVQAYNKMMTKLSESAQKLADTEREMAWREMARQIAHEIRNPLTPMKLNIQHLLKAWENKNNDFNKKFENVMQSLSEQIDNLSAISMEFSNFAKMPVPNTQPIDIITKIQNTVFLFETTDNKVDITVNTNDHKKLLVLADQEQISRVFINIIKNGIQSIPHDKKGVIIIETRKENQYALITIEDNGFGIPSEKQDKLFTPSFTTKSGGMGLGLAIVKNIIDASGGKIWFETEHYKGTKFYIQLPLSNNSH